MDGEKWEKTMAMKPVSGAAPEQKGKAPDGAARWPVRGLSLLTTPDGGTATITVSLGADGTRALAALLADLASVGVA